MENKGLKHYFLNISLLKDLPKIIFIFLYLTILALTFTIFFMIDWNYKKNYEKYIQEKITSIESIRSLNRATAYSEYVEMLQSKAPETQQIRNIAIILWDDHGNVLWHSNKLIEKFVINDSKKSNELFKGMSLLDIPEKKFKAHEEYEKSKKTLTGNKINTRYKNRQVFHFYKIPDTNVYVQILRDFDKIISWKLFIFIQVGILLLSAVIALLSAFLFKLIIQPVNAIGASIEHYMQYKDSEILPEDASNEIGQLVIKYNNFIKNLTGKSQIPTEDTDDRNQKMIHFLQDKLVRKSIHKSNLVELLLYPRSAEGEFRKFVTLEEGDGYTNILYVHFDINNVESNIEKHILQDRFKEISARSTNLSDIVRELQSDCISHSDLGPGFLLIRIRNNQMSWTKSGPFHLFMIDKKSENSWPLMKGYDYIPVENIEIAEEQIDKNTLLVIAEELLDMLNLDTEEFNNQIINPVVHQKHSGKPLLLNIMKTIEDLYPDTMKQYPLISLVRIK